MARKAAAGMGSRARALARAARCCLRGFAAAVLLAGLTLAATPCRAEDPVRGEATFTSQGGYARLVLKLAEDIDTRS
jgi:hypothetical protein